MKYHVTLDGREIVVEVDGDHVVVDGTRLSASLTTVPGTPIRQLLLDGHSYALPAESLGGGRWAITAGGERRELEVVDERTRHIRSLTGTTARKAGTGTLKAPMPGLVVRVQVEAGQQVAAGMPVIVLEAMKMENQLKAAAPGVVAAIKVEPGQAVQKGQVLVEFAE